MKYGRAVVRILKVLARKKFPLLRVFLKTWKTHIFLKELVKTLEEKVSTQDQEIKSQKSLIEAQAEEIIQQKLKISELDLEIEQKEPKITNSSIVSINLS